MERGLCPTGRRAGGIAAGILGSIAWAIVAAGAAAAQDNPMLGAWTAVDPATGVHDVLTVTPEHITFGAASPRIPYRLEPDGEALSVYLADGERPARFLLFDDANAQLSVPGGPAIALRRQPPKGAAAAARESVIDAAAAALLTRSYDPLDPSLENLLSDGWQVEELVGSDDGATLLMRNDGHHALCVLLPREGSGDDAAADCRHLN